MSALHGSLARAWTWFASSLERAFAALVARNPEADAPALPIARPPVRMGVLRTHPLRCGICTKVLDDGDAVFAYPEHPSLTHAKCAVFIEHEDGTLRGIGGEERPLSALAAHPLAVHITEDAWGALVLRSLHAVVVDPRE